MTRRWGACTASLRRIVSVTRLIRKSRRGNPGSLREAPTDLRQSRSFRLGNPPSIVARSVPDFASALQLPAAFLAKRGTFLQARNLVLWGVGLQDLSR